MQKLFSFKIRFNKWTTQKFVSWNKNKKFERISRSKIDNLRFESIIKWKSWGDLKIIVYPPRQQTLIIKSE